MSGATEGAPVIAGDRQQVADLAGFQLGAQAGLAP